ncbi:helix-turn-helix domain-containing protein [Corynebacterium mayonis]|uniref:AraC-like ligand-binding domain-containing protein n=1 Tax=Corynebacterium mayonis TaxID=3062461 RepID=UPI0031401437
MTVSTGTALNLAAWQDATSAFGELRFRVPNPVGFRASIRRMDIDEVSLFYLDTPAHTVSLDENRCVMAPAWCKLSLQLAGEVRVSQDGRTAQLGPGDLALYVTNRPYRLDYVGPQRSLVMLFPAKLVQLSEASIRTITARTVSSSQGLGTVIVPLLRQLANNFSLLDGPHGSALIHSALDMLVAVLAAELDPDHGTNRADTFIRRAHCFIDAHLADPQLSPRHIADGLYISVRHLHGLFSGTNTTVAAVIRSKRLRALRAKLADPARADESIVTLGTEVGLPDPSHLSRLFKAEYDISPSAYRKQALGADT